MLVAVVLSQAITMVLPFAVPLPLVQIALGALLAAVMDVGVPLNPDIFFLLFIPPLLFLDGWRIPNRGLFKDAATILELALGLVVFTVLGMGFFRAIRTFREAAETAQDQSVMFQLERAEEKEVQLLEALADLDADPS